MRIRAVCVSPGRRHSLLFQLSRADLCSFRCDPRSLLARLAALFTLVTVTLGGILPATVGTASATTLEIRVAASPDDAEEFADGSMYLTSSDLELIHDSSDQTVGIRWAGLAIPKGAMITAAYIQFSAKED